jgi:hypothetical protein
MFKISVYELVASVAKGYQTILTRVTPVGPDPVITEFYRSCGREEGVTIHFWSERMETGVVRATKCNVNICKSKYLPKAQVCNRRPGCKCLLHNFIYS